MARANVHGTGVYVTQGVRQSPSLLWKITQARGGSNTTPAVEGANVYFGRAGRLYAVDARTGEDAWSRKLDNVDTSAPAVTDDTVYIGGWEELYALSTDTGEVKRIFQPEQGSDDRYVVDPLVEDGTVYFGGWSHAYAIDAETGLEKWKVKLGGVTVAVPAISDGTVYFATFRPDIRHEAYLYALDSNTGQEKWKFTASRGGIGGAVAVTDGIVYVSTRDNGLVALDAKNGQQKWAYETETGITTAPAVAYGTVYITHQGALLAVDAQTGKEKGRFQAGGGLSSDPVIADGIVYWGTSSGNLGVLFGGQLSGALHAVDAHNGKGLWEYSVVGSATTAPAVSDGVVYFGADEGTFYAVE